MPTNLKLPPILPKQNLVSQESKSEPQNGSLKSMYTTTTKLHYQQPTQYPGSVLRAVEAFFKSKILGSTQQMPFLLLNCLEMFAVRCHFFTNQVLVFLSKIMSYSFYLNTNSIELQTFVVAIQGFSLLASVCWIIRDFILRILRKDAILDFGIDQLS